MTSSDEPFVFQVGETVKKVIVNLTLTQEINVLDVHKAIFLYFFLSRKRNPENYKKTMKILDFSPYKNWLFSEFVEEALVELRSYQDIYVSGKGEKAKVKSSPKVTSMPEYQLSKDEQKILKLIEPLNQWDVEIIYPNENKKATTEEGAKA